MPATLYPEPDTLEAYRESNPTLSFWEALGATSSPATPMPPLPPPPEPPEPGVTGSAYDYPEPDAFEDYRGENSTLSVWEALGYTTIPTSPPPAISGLATQAEAQAGVVNNKWMSPLRVKEAIDALGSGFNPEEDIEITNPAKGLIQNNWRLTIDDDGVIVTTPVS